MVVAAAAAEVMLVVFGLWYSPNPFQLALTCVPTANAVVDLFVLSGIGLIHT